MCDVSCPLGDPCLSLYSLEEQGYKESSLFGTIQYLVMHAEQRRARLDLVGRATSDGAAHVLSCGYRGHTPIVKWAHFPGRKSFSFFLRAPYILRTTYFSGDNGGQRCQDSSLTIRRRLKWRVAA